MRLFTNLIFISAVILAVSVQAIDQDVQVDILIKKIQFASKEHRYKDLVVEMDKFKKLSNSLNQPLSDNFQYMYVDALERIGDYIGLIQYANAYMQNFGKKGAHYDEIIEKIAKYEDKANEEAADREFQLRVASSWINEKKRETYTGVNTSNIYNDSWVQNRCNDILKSIKSSRKSAESVTCDCESTYHPAYDYFPACTLEYRVNRLLD